MRDSIIQQDKCCWVCGTTQCLERHHALYGTANRKQADKYRLTVWLCHEHHTGSNFSAHMNIALDTEIKKAAQTAFEDKVGSREEFMRIFGRNYL